MHKSKLAKIYFDTVIKNTTDNLVLDILNKKFLDFNDHFCNDLFKNSN